MKYRAFCLGASPFTAKLRLVAISEAGTGIPVAIRDVSAFTATTTLVAGAIVIIGTVSTEASRRVGALTATATLVAGTRGIILTVFSDTVRC